MNTNGILSFRDSFLAYEPSDFEKLVAPLIAPFWHDASIDRSGDIYYRTITSHSTHLNKVQQVISSHYNDMEDFEVSEVFVATYDGVAAVLYSPYTHPYDDTRTYEHLNGSAVSGTWCALFGEEVIYPSLHVH